MADIEQRVGQWADDEVTGQSEQPLVKTNSDGTKTIITYRINEEGKKIKVTQKVKEIVVKETVNKEVAKRKKWAKFGAEKDTAPGPDFRTTNLGEPVFLILGTAWKTLEKEEEDKKAQETAKNPTYQRIKCRQCQGPHFTSKCPYRDTIISGAEGADGAEGVEDATAAGPAPGTPAAAAAASSGGRYVPAHLRNRADGSVPRTDRERDDSTTIKITQLNESVDEYMLRDELLSSLGPIARANIVRNKETGRSKGLAFVQFASEMQAERAIEYLNGKGYHNLILHVEWSKPKK